MSLWFIFFTFDETQATRKFQQRQFSFPPGIDKYSEDDNDKKLHSGKLSSPINLYILRYVNIFKQIIIAKLQFFYQKHFVK